MPTHVNQICPKCGAPLRRFATGGTCVRCMLAAGLSEAMAARADIHGETLDETRPRLGRLGHYELLEELAHGGMGIVYLGRDLSLNRVGALQLVVARPFARQNR